MKKYLLTMAVMLAGVSLFVSCEDDNEGGDPPQHVKYTNGAYVVNSGNMGGGINGTLTYIDYTTNTAYQKVFQNANDGQSLGSTPNDGMIYGNKIYVAVDQENTIEVLDRTTRKRVEQIKTTELLGATEGVSPRHLIAGGGYVFFTTYGGVMAQVDTTNFELQAKYTVGSYPEGLIGVGQRIYVANSDYGHGKGNISVITLPSKEVQTYDILGITNPKGFFMVNSHLYVLDMGGYDAQWNQTGCGIYRMENGRTELVADATMAAVFDGKFYLINNAWGTVTEPVYTIYDPSTGEVTGLNLSEKVDAPIDIKVDPVTGHIFVLSYNMGEYYPDYSANGYVNEYDAQGNKLRRYETGVGSVTMFFDGGVYVENK